MKLVRQKARVKSLETRAAMAAGAAVGLVWDGDYEALSEDEVELGCVSGAHLAVDLVVGWQPGPVMVAEIDARERLSSDISDYGVVTARDGSVIGRVSSIAGELVTIEYTAEGLPRLPLETVRRAALGAAAPASADPLPS